MSLLGKAVVFCDSKMVDHLAMITCVHGEGEAPCVNLVHVSDDPTKQDNYGRQIERVTSVSHGSSGGCAHGFYWRREHEERIPWSPPVEV
jgi:hypothetical protein